MKNLEKTEKTVTIEEIDNKIIEEYLFLRGSRILYLFSHIVEPQVELMDNDTYLRDIFVRKLREDGYFTYPTKCWLYVMNNDKLRTYFNNKYFKNKFSEFKPESDMLDIYIFNIYQGKFKYLNEFKTLKSQTLEMFNTKGGK